jgi:hypothetical protein
MIVEASAYRKELRQRLSTTGGGVLAAKRFLNATV